MLFEKKQCGRCPRKTEAALTMEQVLERAQGKTPPVLPALVVSVDGQAMINYDYLCGECNELVAKAIGTIARRPTKASSTREVAPKEKKEKTKKE